MVIRQTVPAGSICGPTLDEMKLPLSNERENRASEQQVEELVSNTASDA